MKLLFEIDKKDYDPNGTVGIRPSVRGIIVRDGKIALVHSLKYDYYKFPGGGAENCESHLETLIREVSEESGLTVIPESVREYGMVRRKQKGNIEEIFVQDNYYYFCSAEEKIDSQNLDDYEADERFTLEFVTASTAIDVNKNRSHSEKTGTARFEVMLERETTVLEMLIKDGISE